MEGLDIYLTCIVVGAAVGLYVELAVSDLWGWAAFEAIVSFFVVGATIGWGWGSLGLVGAFIAFIVCASKAEARAIAVGVSDIEEYQAEFEAYIKKTSEYIWLKDCPLVCLLEKDIAKTEFPTSLYRYRTGTTRFGHNLLLFVGKKEEYLYFFPTEDHFFANGNWSNKATVDSTPREIKPFYIKIEDIEYFIKSGDRQIYTTVSGGGDTSGALVGGLLFGATGAIIGGTEPISTTVHTDDTREVVLYFKKDGESKSLHFSHDSFESLRSIIPEKDAYSKMMNH